MTLAHSINFKISNSHKIKLQRQTGIALMEALISMLLCAVIGLGLAYALAKASTAQRTMNAQNIIVSKLKTNLQNSAGSLSNACPASGSSSNTSTMTIGSMSASVTKTCTMTNITISALTNTQTIAVPVVNYSVTSASLLGADKTLVLTN